jgi:CheY-like chemotaxis protein
MEKNMKVILIDDSNFSLTMMRKKLEEILPDAEIISTTDGQHGIELFDKENPDLIVTDLLMPEVTGESIVKHVRSTDSQCFVCVASANIQKAVQQELMDMGADLFLEKPVNQEMAQKLLDSLKQKLDKKN